MRLSDIQSAYIFEGLREKLELARPHGSVCTGRPRGDRGHRRAGSPSRIRSRLLDPPRRTGRYRPGSGRSDLQSGLLTSFQARTELRGLYPIGGSPPLCRLDSPPQAIRAGQPQDRSPFSRPGRRARSSRASRTRAPGPEHAGCRMPSCDPPAGARWTFAPGNRRAARSHRRWSAEPVLQVFGSGQRDSKETRKRTSR